MCTHTLLPRNRENGAKGKLRKWLLCHVGVWLMRVCVRGMLLPVYVSRFALYIFACVCVLCSVV